MQQVIVSKEKETVLRYTQETQKLHQSQQIWKVEGLPFQSPNSSKKQYS